MVGLPLGLALAKEEGVPGGAGGDPRRARLEFTGRGVLGRERESSEPPRERRAVGDADGCLRSEPGLLYALLAMAVQHEHVPGDRGIRHVLPEFVAEAGRVAPGGDHELHSLVEQRQRAGGAQPQPVEQVDHERGQRAGPEEGLQGNRGSGLRRIAADRLPAILKCPRRDPLQDSADHGQKPVFGARPFFGSGVVSGGACDMVSGRSRQDQGVGQVRHDRHAGDLRRTELRRPDHRDQPLIPGSRAGIQGPARHGADQPWRPHGGGRRVDQVTIDRLLLEVGDAFADREQALSRD